MSASFDSWAALHALPTPFLILATTATSSIIDASGALLRACNLEGAQLLGMPLASVENELAGVLGGVAVAAIQTAIDEIRNTGERRELTISPPYRAPAAWASTAASRHLILHPLRSQAGVVDAVMAQFEFASPAASSPPGQTNEVLVTAVSAAELGIFDCPLPDGTMLLNQVCQEYFFLTAQESLDANQFFKLLHPEDRDRLRVTLNNAILHGSRFDTEFRVVSPDGRSRWLRAIGRASYHADGAANRCNGVMIDISSDKHIEHALRESEEQSRLARAAAEHANLIKDEFLSTLSHELRTPLNTILGWTQVLQRSSARLSDKAHTALATIERSARQQARLIDDLLDASAIIAGKIYLDLQPIRCSEVISASVAISAPVAAARNMRIDVLIDEPGIAIEGDAQRLQQILCRLLSNAIKFSSDGSTITVRQLAGHDKVLLTVSDTGQGIAPAFLPSLFSRFSQADSSITRTHMGLGLGLSIVKSIIELHGGKVSAASPGVSRGAVFTIELPTLSTADSAAPIQPQPVHHLREGDSSVDQQNSWHADIIVVDDEIDTGTVMGEVLQQAGATVRLASSATEALQLIRARRPDLLISDIGMPQVDGYQLLQMVRAEEPADASPLPAIALTAFARPEDKHRAIAAGYLIHLAKPVESADLITAAKLAVRRPQRTFDNGRS